MCVGQGYVWWTRFWQFDHWNLWCCTSEPKHSLFCSLKPKRWPSIDCCLWEKNQLVYGLDRESNCHAKIVNDTPWSSRLANQDDWSILLVEAVCNSSSSLSFDELENIEIKKLFKSIDKIVRSYFKCHHKLNKKNYFTF